MERVSKADRAAKLVALADSMKKFGPVYSRLPAEVQNRERKFSSLSAKVTVADSEGFTHSTFDLNRSYGL